MKLLLDNKFDGVVGVFTATTPSFEDGEVLSVSPLPPLGVCSEASTLVFLFPPLKVRLLDEQGSQKVVISLDP